MSVREPPGSSGAEAGSDEPTRDAQRDRAQALTDRTESQSGTFTAAAAADERSPRNDEATEERDAAGSETGTAETVPAERRDRKRAVAEAMLERGEALGRYVILDVLGAGGMGVVYTAYDPSLDRKVAIKIMRAKYRAEEGKVRMQREAHALARLSHPNVVAVHDVGTFGGRVFVAMEFVEGVSVREWLKQDTRDWREVVGVFCDAGQGLAAAHAAGLTHRDVKPSNILIDERGRVRILDFGLARATDSISASSREEEPAAPDALTSGNADPLDTSITRTGAGVGTPAYMSPEQQAGTSSPLADQYSFCVSLYEALFGKRPEVGELPSPPSSDVPARIVRAVLRGLAFRPEDRFAAMEELLHELEVKPPARSARIWIGVAAAMVLVAAVAVGLAARSATRPEPCGGARALLRGAWDAEVRKQIRESFGKSTQRHAADALRAVEDALDRWSDAWVEMRTETCVATRVRGDQTEELMELRVQCLDQRRDELRALTQLFVRSADDEVVDNAAEAVLGLSSLDRCANASALKTAVPLPESEAERTQINAIRARLMDATALERAGKYERGLTLVRKVVEDAKETGYSPLSAEALHLQANLQEETADHQGAEKTLYEAAAEASAARDDYRVAQIWVEASWVLGYKQGDHEAAERFLNVAKAAARRAGDPPPLVASLEERAGSLAYVRGEYRTAEAHYQRALDLLTRALGPEHPDLTALLNNLGEVYRREGRYEEAREKYEEALRIRERALGPHHPQVAVHVNNIGVLLESMGKFEEAQKYFERALDIRERSLGPNHPKLAHTLIGLGSILARQKKYQTAREYTERALDIWRESLGDDHPNLLYPHHNLGDIYRAEGKCDLAIPHYQQAIDIFARSVGDKHPTLAYPLTGMGHCLLDSGDPAGARVPLERALALREGNDIPGEELAETSFALARALWDGGGSRARALDLAHRAQKISDSVDRSEEAGQVDSWLRDRQ